MYIHRPRRLRKSANIRRLVRETILHINDLVYPLFVVPGSSIKQEIPSMPDCYHFSVDMLPDEIKEIADLGIPGMILFGLPERKDSLASEAYAKDGIVQTAVKVIKDIAPQITVITDVCLCQYMDHGHCGIVKDNIIENDSSVKLLVKTALSHAKAGADIVAPSDMMDHRVGAMREALDQEGLTDTIIMSYAAKYCSAFYGPFRDAAESSPKFGNRNTYQMDFANSDEAIKEVLLDLEEGADIVMIKPALSYLDIIFRIKEIVDVPVAAYSVSGEYSMIKAAIKQGFFEENRIILELLTSIKRSGASIILTYFAKKAAKLIK